MNIGFIGLGHMGLPMAINLIKAGYQVQGFDLNPQAMTKLIAAGGQAATNLQQVATQQDVIITMLQTGEQLRQVCTSADGLLENLTPNKLFIDCSTIDVPTSRDIHQQAAAKGILFVDAPVSGGVAGAEAASLTFMVGGNTQAYTIAEPILAKMGQKIIHTGAAGSGVAAKMCNNLVLGISMIAVAEAFALAEKLNLAQDKLYEVLENSSGRCWVTDKYPPVPGLVPNVPADNNYTPGFTTAMMLKDLILSQQAAKENNLNLRMGSSATELYQRFNDQGYANLDFSGIINLVRGM